MPFPNHHAARLVDPKKFDPDSFRQKRRKTASGKTYTVVFGHPASGKNKEALVAQSHRYPSKQWAVPAARAHATKHDAISFEKATGKPSASKIAASHDPLKLAHDVTICPMSCDHAHPVGAQRVAGGIPTQRFVKRLIYDGQFVKESDARGFVVSRDCIEHWAKTHAAMRANGTTVRIPNKHCKNPMPDNPNDTHGVVVDMFTEETKVKDEPHLCLSMVCEITGTDSIAAAMKNDVSVFSPREWTDSAGNKYVRPITHVAMVPDPLIQGLGGFIPLAASQNRKEKRMDVFKTLQKKLGLDDELTEENVVEIVFAQHEALVKERDTLVADAGKNEDDTDDDKTKKAAKDADPLKVVNPALLRLSMKDRRRDFEDLVTGGNITPASCAEFVKTHVTDEAVAASLSAGEVGQKAHDTLIASLKQNVAIKTGEKTNRQVLEDSLKGADGKGDNAVIANAKALAAAASGKSE